jgi:hypothetical protein
VSCNEDDRNTCTFLREFALEVEAAQSRHAYVEYQAGGDVGTTAFQKLLPRRKRHCSETQRHYETLQGLAYRFIVVDYEYPGLDFVHGAFLSSVGSVN